MSAPPMPYSSSWETSSSPHNNNVDFMMSIKPGCRGDPRMNRAVAAKLKNPHISLFDALDIGGFTYPRNVDAATMDDSRVTLGQRKNQLNRRLRMARQNQKNAELKKKQNDNADHSSLNVNKKEPGSPSNKPRGTSPLVIANSYLRQKRNQAVKSSAAKPSSCANKRAAPLATTNKIIHEQPQTKKQRLSVASTSSTTSCGGVSAQPCPPSSASNDLLLGNNNAGITLNYVLNQTINPITSGRDHQGSVTPVMGDNINSSFPASNLPVGDVASAFATTTTTTTTDLPNISTSQHDATAWLSANSIGGNLGGGFQDSADVDEIKIDATSGDFAASSLALPLEQNPTILGLPMALGVDQNNNGSNSSTSCVSVSSADGSLQLQQQASVAGADTTNNNSTLLPQNVSGSACGVQAVGLGDSEPQQQQQLQQGSAVNASDTSVADMDSRREDIGLRLFQSGLQDLYRKSMMAAGFSFEEANDSSPRFHRFAFQAWKNECERLQTLMLQDQQTTPNP